MAHAKTVNIIKPTDYERFNNLYAFSHTGTGRRGAVRNRPCIPQHATGFPTVLGSEHPKNEIRMRKAFDIATIHKFERHLLERMLKLNTMSTYLRMLRAVYNRALLAGLTDYVPGLFKHVYTGTRADVKRALPPAEMGQALDISASLHRELKEAQIWFALLFLLRGMPFADLARLRKCDFKDGVITYRRQKTGRQIRVHVTEEAAELIRRCADRRTDSPYLLNILGDENCRFPLGRREEYRHYQQVLRRFNRKLKLLAAALRLGGKLSSYVAKHNAFAI